ncbi:alpha-tubulin suppressor-like RCC1 family protein [Prauserella isguenensis]|uniref:Alpha-tubulin suppressor-like RCC1 family protein n=1 Tax=Prauserella isguenensis TaxID=1470180 RepID=A0A839S2C6_9PSEU|nr:hypothetical protein [Prauserella isguenensis]MBB3050857.1 alpha-tubulin suppressor-like RCC1 family protein [Prauserella isguenensis]
MTARGNRRHAETSGGRGPGRSVGLRRTGVTTVLVTVVTLVLVTAGSQAYFSDTAEGSAVSSGSSPSLTIRDLTVGGRSEGSGVLADHGQPYEVSFRVVNDGEAPWRGNVTLFDHFDTDSGTDLGERGVVLAWPGATPRSDIASAVGAGDYSTATVIGPNTADTGGMPGANPATTGQAVELPEFTLGAGRQRSFTFRVVVLSNELDADAAGMTRIAGGSDAVAAPLRFGVLARPTGPAGTRGSTRSDGRKQVVDAHARMRVNTPPVLRDASANTGPFLGQVGGDPATDSYLRALVRATDVEDDPDGDGERLTGSISWKSDFDPDTVGEWSARYDVTDSAGASAEPVTVSGETWTFVKIVGGRDHTLALDSTGRVWTWGRGADGRLGSGKAGDAGVPTLLPTFDGGDDTTRVVDIAAGSRSSYAVTTDGRVWTWGREDHGLGHGSTHSDHPVAFDLPEPAEQISASHHTTGAVTTGGNVYAWGENAHGQVGDGTTTDRDTPVAVDVSGVEQLSMGHRAGAAITGDGGLHTWGSDGDGLLGDGTDSHGDSGNPPTRIDARGTGYSMVSMGRLHALAITGEGVVHGWGHDGAHRIGGTGDSNEPTALGLEEYGPAKHVAAGYDRSWVTLSDGRLVTAGANDHGELFTGTGPAHGFDAATDAHANSVVMAAGGRDSAHVLRLDGHVYSVGRNDDHQLGDGTTTTSTTKSVKWGFDPPPVP